MRSRALQNAWKAMFGDDMTVGDGNIPKESGVVVFDDYDATDDVRATWVRKGHIVISYTDFNERQLADMVVNQNVGAKAACWFKSLCGPRFFALRDEYFNLRTDASGGVFDADAEKRNLDSLEFAHRMALASCVITAAGITAYEALYLGKPLLLRCVADNQELTYNGLISGGYALPANDANVSRAHDGTLPELRSGRTLVDGLGAGRVCREIFNLWRQLHG